MAQLAFSSSFYCKICFKFCILEQIIATVLFICISSINNKSSLLRFQSTTAPTNRGWSAPGLMVCTSCKTSYNVGSHSYIIIWGLGGFGRGGSVDIRGGSATERVSRFQICRGWHLIGDLDLVKSLNRFLPEIIDIDEFPFASTSSDQFLSCC